MIKSLPISTSGIIEILVRATNSHWVPFRVVSPKRVAKNGIKYTDKIIANKNTKLQLKNLFLKIFIVNILF